MGFLMMIFWMTISRCVLVKISDVLLDDVSSNDHEKIVQQALNGIVVAPNISVAVQQLSRDKSHLQEPLIGIVKPTISSRFKETATNTTGGLCLKIVGKVWWKKIQFIQKWLYFIIILVLNFM